MSESGVLLGGSLLMLTGIDIISNEIFLDIIAKLGVIGVLWLWLKDMRQQMKEQREHYQKLFDDLKSQQDEQNDKIENLITTTLMKLLKR